MNNPTDSALPIYIYDPSIDVNLDWELRVLFSTCWPGPMFRNKRYNTELPSHRWIIRGEDQSLAAHLALHDKMVLIHTRWVRIGGIAEVCVHPSHRGKKWVSRLLGAASDWMMSEGIEFSLLFGRSEIYASQGYIQIPNLCRRYVSGRNEWETGPIGGLLVRPMTKEPWPDAGILDLRCPPF